MLWDTNSSISGFYLILNVAVGGYVSRYLNLNFLIADRFL